jgi:hypothetical protein
MATKHTQHTHTHTHTHIHTQTNQVEILVLRLCKEMKSKHTQNTYTHTNQSSRDFGTFRLLLCKWHTNTTKDTHKLIKQRSWYYSCARKRKPNTHTHTHTHKLHTPLPTHANNESRSWNCFCVRKSYPKTHTNIPHTHKQSNKHTRDATKKLHFLCVSHCCMICQMRM